MITASSALHVLAAARSSTLTPTSFVGALICYLASASSRLPLSVQLGLMRVLLRHQHHLLHPVPVSHCSHSLVLQQVPVHRR